MKKIILEFLRRGLGVCWIGPIVLAIIYLILQGQGIVDNLSVNEVCTGIFSLTALAFVVGAMNAIYQIEKLPLMWAILIHGCVLYLGYLATYLLNGWLATGIISVIVFSVIFIVGYLIIWGIIYLVIKKNTAKINDVLKKKQESGEV